MALMGNKNKQRHFVLMSNTDHRDLDQMELKVKGKFITSSKVENFQNPSCLMLEKINENYDKK